MTTSFFAQPYDLSAQGFYFSTFEEYEEKSDTNVNSFGQPVEEYEIQVIDCDSDFSKHVAPDQSNLEQWIEWEGQYDDLSRMEQYAFEYLCDVKGKGADIDDIFSSIDDVIVFEGSKTDYAYEVVNDIYDIEKMLGDLSSYFDYESYARDLECNGDIVEVAYNVWVVNANSL